jgi:hypothetical protein
MICYMLLSVKGQMGSPCAVEARSESQYFTVVTANYSLILISGKVRNANYFLMGAV